ncbi:MAG: hypothetical protein HXY24_11530 [Rubrivivax sp.]|nr:hypothetical protein [Rubrivivax sp.]
MAALWVCAVGFSSLSESWAQAGNAGGQSTVLQISSVALQPAQPITGDAVRAVVKLKDTAPDPFPLYFRWKINDQIVGESDQPELGIKIKRGDVLELLVFAGTNRDETRAMHTSVTVGNAAPTVARGKEQLSADGVYTAQLQSKDPEGDPVTLVLQQGPDGMTVDQKTGTLRWKAPNGTQGSFPIEIEASDPSGAKVLLNYSITIRQEETTGDKSNAAPAKPAS